MLAPHGNSLEYECVKEMVNRLINLGEKEVSLTKMSILLYLLYKEDKLGDDVFKFKFLITKNVYGIPSNENVALNFEEERTYRGSKKRFCLFTEKQEELIEEILVNYGTLTDTELYTMIQYDRHISEARIGDIIAVPKKTDEKLPSASFMKRLAVNKTNRARKGKRL